MRKPETHRVTDMGAFVYMYPLPWHIHNSTVYSVFMITNPWQPELKVIVSFLEMLDIASIVFSLTQQKPYVTGWWGSEHQEAQQMHFFVTFSLHTFVRSYVHTHSHPHTITIHYFITAFIMILTKLASATGNKLLNHTAVFSTSSQKWCKHFANHTSVLRHN